MIEVFKTNVDSPASAARIISAIQQYNASYRVNFDLYDSDRILRVICQEHRLSIEAVISIVSAHGFAAVVLSDTEPLGVSHDWNADRVF